MATEMWLGTGSLAAPGQAADDLPDRHDEEQLPGHRLKHRECLSGIGGRHQVPVPDGCHRDEAEEQVLAQRAGPRRAEERHAPELAGRLVGEGEEHADQQVGSDGPEQRLGVDLRRKIRWRTIENGAIRYSRQQTVKIPPSSSPGLCANKLTTATTAARHSTMSAMRRARRRACEVRKVSQTV